MKIFMSPLQYLTTLGRKTISLFQSQVWLQDHQLSKIVRHFEYWKLLQESIITLHSSTTQVTKA
jgi:hypothetical protein